MNARRDAEAPGDLNEFRVGALTDRVRGRFLPRGPRASA